MTRSFDVFFDLPLNKRLSKQSLGWWFETLSRPLWRHCNVMALLQLLKYVVIADTSAFNQQAFFTDRPYEQCYEWVPYYPGDALAERIVSTNVLMSPIWYAACKRIITTLHAFSTRLYWSVTLIWGHLDSTTTKVTLSTSAYRRRLRHLLGSSRRPWSNPTQNCHGGTHGEW